MLKRYSTLALALLATAVLGTAASAQSIDTPELITVDAGHGKVRLCVVAGATGAPNGFMVRWMKASDLAARGGQWATEGDAALGYARFEGVGTLNTWGQSSVDFSLGANEVLDVEIGDTYAETGVTGTVEDELDASTSYVFSVAAIGAAGALGGYSSSVESSTSTQGEDCTYTIGYWKNHPGAWPVASLTLGTVNYSAAQLMAILNQPVGGNGLISLAHQLIAAKLNVANGASPAAVAAAIAAADALIGALVVPPVGAGYLAPGATSSTTQTLDDFNNGLIGPGHCGSTDVKKSTWGQVKTRFTR